MRLLAYLNALSSASGTALERGLDGEHGHRSSIGILASPPAFKGAARASLCLKSVAEDGGVTERVVWRVPQAVPPSGHGDKSARSTPWTACV